ncbi:L-threonylcarbamoyladenylate synthase [Microcoleus sp. FACHB-68]|uniref:L-threonylcarbamoyladenylate synthase n=1 Tax=Microcoleus sp. FACHB-68 TaxID=2692826 RepID=UPI001686102C|nr:L-threonylcarbamoyladenylate synthase [Microcoleus sp. FACHB-68]MBD1937605.1 L-threonylcarbamoyladenylate synthase [Microcoleus sp. FACHB-68]
MTQVSLDALVIGAKSGKLVSFPTDTVPALASRPDCAELIFAAKQRTPDKPLILMGASSADLWPYVTGTPEELQIWQQVADQYWPGALTLVLPASERVPAVMNPLEPTTIGVRVPNYALARQILAQTGPLATTSANRSGEPALQTMAEIEAHFPEVFTLRLDKAQLISPNAGIPSTVAKWTGRSWEILRQGALKLI